MPPYLVAPDLRGLTILPGPRVPPELAGLFVPYEQTLRDWMITDSGGRFQRNRFRTPIATFRTPREAAIARRARFRAIQNLWRTDKLSILDEPRSVRSQRLDAGVAIVASGVLSAALAAMCWGSIRMIGDLGILGPMRQSGAAAVLVLLTALGLWIVLCWLTLARDCLRARPITSCRLSAEALEVTTADGERLTSPAPAVSAIVGLGGPIGRLENGQYVHLTPRAIWILRHRPATGDPRQQMWKVVRLALIGASVIGITLPLAIYVGEGSVHPVHFLQMVAVLIVALTLLTTLPLFLALTDRWFSNDGRHRRRRRSQNRAA